jgi:hypothetical protein
MLAKTEGKMNQETLTLIGAFGEAAIGLLGDIIGTWFSIKKTCLISASSSS